MKVEFTAHWRAIEAALIPAWAQADLHRLATKADKHGGTVSYAITLPRRPRTTGERSQNHRINGHCQQIAMETGCSFGAVKMHMKRLAIDRGYPFDTLPDGTVAPKSEADVTVEEATYLIETINQFAGEYGIELRENKE